MRPVLEMLAYEHEHTAKEIRERIGSNFELTQEELEVMLPSGRAKLFANRVGWAISYLYRTKLLERPRRSVYRITPRGQEVLAQSPGRVDLKVLAQFEELQSFAVRSRLPVPSPQPRAPNLTSPSIRPRSRSMRPTGSCAARLPKRSWSKRWISRERSSSSWSWTYCERWGTAAPTRMRLQAHPRKPHRLAGTS